MVFEWKKAQRGEGKRYRAEEKYLYGDTSLAITGWPATCGWHCRVSPSIRETPRSVPNPIRQPDVGISCVGWKRTSNLHKRQSFRSTKQNRSFSFCSACHGVRIGSVSVLLPLHPSAHRGGVPLAQPVSFILLSLLNEHLVSLICVACILRGTPTSRLARRQPLVLQLPAYLLFL